MTKPITINLTLDELKTLDKFVELNDETRPLFDKIRSAYPESKVTFENHGDFDVVSYHDPENSGDETYWRITQPNSFSWWRRYTIPQRLDMVQNKEKEQELEKLYQEQLEREMIKRNLKTSLQEPEQVNTFAPKELEELIREGKEWCEEHPNESVEDYLTPHTPEKTEQLLREAFQKAQQTEEWKETQRKIDGKNPPKFLKFELGENLTDLIYDWWEDIFTKNSNDDMENCIGRLVYWIEEWLPKEQSANSQNVDVEFLVEGFNDAIKKIKSKLR